MQTKGKKENSSVYLCVRHGMPRILEDWRIGGFVANNPAPVTIGRGAMKYHGEHMKIGRDGLGVKNKAKKLGFQLFLLLGIFLNNV